MKFYEAEFRCFFWLLIQQRVSDEQCIATLAFYLSGASWLVLELELEFKVGLFAPL